MSIVCHISYQDSKAMVHMKQHVIHPTEHQYTVGTKLLTETLMIDNINAKLL